MSLAEDLPRSYIGSLSRHTPQQKLSRVSLADLASRSVQDDGATPRRATAVVPPVALDAMDRPEPSVVPMARKGAPSSPESDTSLDLIDRASKGMSFILNRYKQLEAHVKQVDAWSNAQIQAAEAETARWQEAAALAEKRLEECQKSLEVMMRRAETAEQCMKRDKETLAVLQDRIIQAFGMGTDAHDVISAGVNGA